MVKFLLVIKTYKYRIYPTKRQRETLNQHLAVCAELYNSALQERRDAWALERKSISYFDQSAQMAEIRVVREDVAAVNAQALENVLKRVHLAFGAFFRRIKNGEKPGYPRFRSRQRYGSLTFRQNGYALTGNKLRLSRVGMVRVRLHRAITGAIKTLTVKREAGHWFALFAVECEPEPLPESNQAIGIDVGITAFATFSNGSAVENPRYYEKAQGQLRIAARRVARRQRKSNRRQKAIVLLQRAYSRVCAQRSDFHHKLSRAVVNNFGLIAVENLNVRGLARMRLAKQVHDAGWSSFINKLCAKAEEAARIVVKVNPSGTSQTCICGARVPKTLSQRWHECSACGLSAPRDHVSAQIILERGLRFQASTSPVVECVA